MNLRPLDRRTLLRGGATVGCLAFAGLGVERASTSQRAGSSLPLTGSVAGWLAIAPDGSGQLTLVQIDAQSRSWQQVAVETIPPMPSIAGMARRASVAVVGIIASSWGVSAADCFCEWGRIEHRQTGRSISSMIWTEFA
jgi:hypothetical protein